MADGGPPAQEGRKMNAKWTIGRPMNGLLQSSNGCQLSSAQGAHRGAQTAQEALFSSGSFALSERCQPLGAPPPGRQTPLPAWPQTRTPQSEPKPIWRPKEAELTARRLVCLCARAGSLSAWGRMCAASFTRIQFNLLAWGAIFSLEIDLAK